MNKPQPEQITTIRFPQSLHTKLKVLAAQRRVSFRELVLEAVLEYLKRRER